MADMSELTSDNIYEDKVSKQNSYCWRLGMKGQYFYKSIL